MEKKIENLRNRINVRLVKNKKHYLKCTSKPSYMPHKIFDNNFAVIHNSKVGLKFNKSAYIGMCILELGKALMYCKFHYDHIKNKYDNKSKLLFTETDSLIHEIKTEDAYEDFSAIKKCLILVIIQILVTKSKCYDDSNKLVIGKMRDETGTVVIEGTDLFVFCRRQ